MATLSFNKDSKIMEVGIADTEITIQEMVDQIRDFEDDPSPAGGMDIPKVLDAYGKQPLGGSDSVGMTITIIDWTIKFADRPGPTWVTCSISGGNLTAYDTGTTSYIIPITAAAYVNTNITASSSATSTSQALLEHGAYENRVIIDTDSSYTYSDMSDTRLVGTRLYPVNNIVDARIIAINRGFATFEIIRDMTINSGTDITGFKIIGQSHFNTQVIIDTSTIAVDIIIERCDVSGILDGGTELMNCMVGDLVYFNGHIRDCDLYGTITLGGGDDAVITNCITMDQDLAPEINMGGTGQSVAMPNYSGLMTISNLTDATKNVGIGLNAGAVIIDSTVTAGNFIIAGSGIVYNNSTSITSINIDGLINRELITKASWDEVVYDSTSTETGTAFPVGTLDHPTNNLADAVTIANANNIHKISILTDLTLTQSVAGFIFKGTKTQLIDINNQSTLNSQFTLLKITGTQLTPIKLDTCQMDNVQNLAGSYKDCVMSTTTPMFVKASADVFMNNCRSGVPGSLSPVIDYTNGGIGFNNRAYSGGIKIINSTDVANTSSHEFIAGKFNFDNSNTAGTFSVRGVLDATNIDSTATATIVLNGAVSQTLVADSVWDETLADHVDTGSTGEALSNVSGGSSPAVIAAAVWDEPTNTHTTAGTFGKLVQFIKLLILSK